ncbi:unnamed protein product [Calypogeia fissa]
MTVPLPDADQQQPASPPLADDLILAARYGDLEELRAILSLAQAVLLVDVQDDQGRTALHMAAANGHLEVVQALVGAGANVNAKNAEQNSPLHYAALNAHIPVIQELISKGANAAALNRHERTPLDEAIGRNNAAVVDAINTAVAAQLIDATDLSLSEMETGSHPVENSDD